MKTFIVVSCMVLAVMAKPQGYNYNPPSPGLNLALLPPNPISAVQFSTVQSAAPVSVSQALPPISSHGSLGLGSHSSGGSLSLGSSYSVSQGPSFGAAAVPAHHLASAGFPSAPSFQQVSTSFAPSSVSFAPASALPVASSASFLPPLMPASAHLSSIGPITSIASAGRIQSLPLVSNAQVFNPAALHAPSFNGPALSSPSFSAPALHAPSFSAPSFSAPSFSAPSFSAPVFSGPSVQSVPAVATVPRFAPSGQVSSSPVPTASTLVQKHIYVHVPPPEEDELSAPRVASVASQKQKHYKIIFIKAPSAPSASEQLLQAQIAQQQQQSEEKTLVYVLVKKPDSLEEVQQSLARATLAQQQPSKPEVFFIKYKTQSGLSQPIPVSQPISLPSGVPSGPQIVQAISAPESADLSLPISSQSVLSPSSPIIVDQPSGESSLSESASNANIAEVIQPRTPAAKYGPPQQ